VGGGRLSIFVRADCETSNLRRAEDWATIREQAVERLWNCATRGWTVTIDIGTTRTTFTPATKVDVGGCGWRAPHGCSLTGKSIEDSGPMFRQVTPEGPALRVWFDHAQGGFLDWRPGTGKRVGGRFDGTGNLKGGARKKADGGKKRGFCWGAGQTKQKKATNRGDRGGPVFGLGRTPKGFPNRCRGPTGFCPY